MSKIYISLGSNINREANVRSGVAALTQIFGELELSSVFESEAVGFVGDAFYNMVIACEVSEKVHQINQKLGNIENTHGRERGRHKFSSRSLDLDLLLYDDLILDEPELVLPRVEILKNAFVLWPLAEIASDLKHPQTHKTYMEHWNEFDKLKEKLQPVAFGF